MSASPPSSPEPSTSRSQEFWFDGGSIILQVEMTQFRVHRGIICANSVVFRDMHELFKPGDRETANGCPVVVLHGDIAVDWNNLLGYMYFPARASKRAEHLAFPLVVPLLRLGKKYQFSDIWALALHTVRVQVPVTELGTWDFFLDDDIPFHRDDTHIPGYWLADHEIDLLNIAVEHDIQTILPIAYYLCTHRYSLHRILSATASKVDGALSTVHPDALKTLLVGRQKLQSAYYKITMSWLTQPDDIPSEDCERAPRNINNESRLWPCEAARKRAFEKIVTLDMDSVRALDWMDHEWYSEFCDACTEKIAETHEAQREKIWRDLTGYFDLPPWSELKDPEC